MYSNTLNTQALRSFNSVSRLLSFRFHVLRSFVIAPLAFPILLFISLEQSLSQVISDQASEIYKLLYVLNFCLAEL